MLFHRPIYNEYLQIGTVGNKLQKCIAQFFEADRCATSRASVETRDVDSFRPPSKRWGRFGQGFTKSIHLTWIVEKEGVKEKLRSYALPLLARPDNCLYFSRYHRFHQKEN